MAYIGDKPSQTLASPTSQYFNGTGSATVFTLNRPVNVSEDLEVFVNNIQQEPGVGKSYTATGTTLTFDAPPSLGTANVYVVYRGLAEVTTRLEHDPNAALAATTGTFSGALAATTGTFSGDLTVDTDTLYVDSTNNRVGIGTASPPTMLSLLGDAEYISIGNNSENYSGIVMYDNQSAVQSGGIHYSSTSTNGNVVSIFNDLTTSYGGANRFSVDSSGRITMPDQPGFCVYMTGNYIRAGEGTKIDPTWGTDHNVGSHFDTTSSVFTAPVAGRYLFAWNIAHTFAGTSNTGDAWSVLPTKNGSDIFNFQGFYGDGGVENGVEGQHAGTVIVNLAANDTFYLKTSGTTATTITFVTGSNLSGYLMG